MSSKYGPGPYGEGHYSAADYADCSATWPLSLAFAGDLQLTPFKELAGVLAVQPVFAADLTSSGINLQGSLSLSVRFGASLNQISAVAGVWPLGVALVPAGMAELASLLAAWPLSVAFRVPADLEIYVGPLWASAAPCPPPLWTEDALCPDPFWRPEQGAGGAVYRPSSYGLRAYGASHYSRGDFIAGAVPLTPWAPAELCHG